MVKIKSCMVVSRERISCVTANVRTLFKRFRCRDVTVMKHLHGRVFSNQENKWVKDMVCGATNDPWCPTLSHENHVRYCSRNQVCVTNGNDRCATACSCSKDSYRSRDTRGRKERAWTTHSPRAVITLAGCALRAPQQRRWSWLIIIAICSLPFAIRRVRVPNIVPYKASWSSRAICTLTVCVALLQNVTHLLRFTESRVSSHDRNIVEFYISQKRAPINQMFK